MAGFCVMTFMEAVVAGDIGGLVLFLFMVYIVKVM